MKIGLEFVNSQEILQELEQQRRIYAQYGFDGNAYGNYYKKISKANVIDTVVDSIMFKFRFRQPPNRPGPYTGRAFNATTNIGGYGKPTRGNFNVAVGAPSGFKPYGALG